MSTLFLFPASPINCVAGTIYEPYLPQMRSFGGSDNEGAAVHTMPRQTFLRGNKRARKIKPSNKPLQTLLPR